MLYVYTPSLRSPMSNSSHNKSNRDAARKKFGGLDFGEVFDSLDKLQQSYYCVGRFYDMNSRLQVNVINFREILDLFGALTDGHASRKSQGAVRVYDDAYARLDLIFKAFCN